MDLLLTMSRTTRVLLLLASTFAGSAAGQVFDNTGNNLLNGGYYFREVIFDLNSGIAAVLYGSISFNGAGGYSMNALEGDTSSGTLQSFNGTGTYSISSSGFGFLSNQLLNSPTYGLVSNGIFIGSSTESGYNDLLVAAPISSQSASTFQGSYTMAYIDPTGQITNGVPFDAQLQMTPNGAGGIGTVNVSAYSTSATPFNQSISNVKYTVSNSAFVLAFPSSSSSQALIQGTEYFYSSPDGSFVFGGSPQAFDMVIGVRNGSSGSNFGGLYYQAGLSEDVSQLSSTGGVGLGSYYGSFSANNTAIIGHQRLAANGVVAGYTYYDSYPSGTNGAYQDTYFGLNNISGNGGAVQVGYGIGPSLGISVALQAPPFSGNGVYLNPTGVVNAASSAPFTAGVSRGELITLVGSNLGPGNLQVASSLPFPTTLGGVQVLINNIPAPLYYVSANQISAIVPYGITTPVAQIQVVNNNVTSNAVTEFVNTTTPGVFTNPPGGIGYAAALHPSDFSLVTKDNPAKIGETIAVFVTGLGDVFPTIADGAAGPSSLSKTSNSITADVSGTTAAVTYAGLAPGLAGLYQINVTIPTGVTAGNDYLGILGPDSYATEATIPVGGSGSALEAHAATSQPRHWFRTTKYLPLPRR